MKANELRIGNLVNIDGYNMYLAEITVLGVNDCWAELLHSFEDISINQNIEYSSLIPIPLTEEWLVKFGFKNILEPKYFELETDSFLITFDNGIIYICVGTYVEEGSKFPHIQYVHQLQNLYHALTGTELTIK